MLKMTPVFMAPHRYGLAAVARPDRVRQVPAVTAAEPDPQERGRLFYIDRIGEARLAAGAAKGSLLNISA